MGDSALALRGVVKRYDGVTALAGASLVVQRGTIHGLVGQNGAGKSTLIKIFAGLAQPDEGTIEIDGVIQAGLTPHKVEALGIHFIHQDRLLVPTFTVGEALFLGNEPVLARGIPLLARRTMRAKADEILRRDFGLRLPAGALIGDLSAAERQIIQITRALLRRPRVLVFDEPTAALVQREADILFGLIRRLKADGVTILYISHYLAEIEALCDRVTVLRNGEDVATVDPKTTQAAAIGALMVARDIAELYPKQSVPIGKEALTVSRISRRGAFNEVSFVLRRGEVMGLTGLLGSGAKELVASLFGLEKIDRGEIIFAGKEGRGTSPASAIARGAALVPEDRRGQGVALGLGIRENVSLASLGRFARFGLIERRRERRNSDSLMRRLQIRAPHRDALVRRLSGGNQQKVVLAKWLSRHSDIYILDEPTVGVDVGAKVEIYEEIGKLAERGAAVLVLSSDLAELVGITDRILVMFRGRIVSDVASASTSTEALIALAAGSEELRHVG